MVDYRIPGYGAQHEWDYPPADADPYMDVPVPGNLYTDFDPDPLSASAPPAPSGLSTRARVGQTASGIFTGPNSFGSMMYETAKQLPGTIARAIDFPAAALRGEVDPLSDTGIGRAADAAGTVTLGGGAVPRAAPGNSLRAGYARPTNPDMEHVTSAAIYGPDGNIYAGRMHYEIGETLPPDVADKFWSDYNPAREGFLTSTGRFVTREEADEIARASGQIDDTLTGQRSLSSEDLMAHNWGTDDDDMLSANRDRTAGAVPLAMDRESRMRRAAEMGFDIDTYHGSLDPSIREFRPDTHSGSRDSANDRLLSEDIGNRANKARPFNHYGYGESVYPVKLRGDYIFTNDLDFVDGWKMLDTPLREISSDSLEEAFHGIRFTEEDLNKTPRQIFQERGYAGVEYENGAEDIGSLSYLTFDPKDIRSTAAAFDPEKSDSANILASNRSVAAGAVPIFSRMEREAQALTTPRATGTQYEATLRNKGVPAEEVEWTGIADWLKERGTLPVTKEELLAQIQAAQTRVAPKVIGGRPRPKRDDLDQEVLSMLREAGIPQDVRASVYSNIVSDAIGTRYPDAMAKLRAYGVSEERVEQFQSNVNEFITGKESSPRYSQYQLPGGENYREVLYTLDNLDYKDPHWDEPGVIAWDRRTDRYLNDPSIPEGYTVRNKTSGNQGPRFDTPEEAQEYLERLPEYLRDQVAVTPVGARPSHTGQRVLFAEEIQSGLHQRGRREGYKLPKDKEQKLLAEKNNIWESEERAGRFEELPTGEIRLVNTPPEIQARLDEITRLHYPSRSHHGVPDAPFKKSWPDLVLRRLVADAVEGGYDAIAWTDGATQAARYDLSKQVRRVYLQNPVFDDTGLRDAVLVAETPSGGPAINQPVTGKTLADYIGKEAADRLVNNPSRMEGRNHILEGEGLSVGGEGMRAFYDTELPRRAKKLFGKWGAVVEDSVLPAAPQTQLSRTPSQEPPQIHILRITPEMRAAVQSEGLPLFANRSKAAGAGVLLGRRETPKRIPRKFYHLASPSDIESISQKGLLGSPDYILSGVDDTPGVNLMSRREMPFYDAPGSMWVEVDPSSLDPNLFENFGKGWWRYKGDIPSSAVGMKNESPKTGGRFADGGAVSVKVNGQTYTGAKKSLRGRPLSKNIEDRRGSQWAKVDRTRKGDRLPSALESLVAPESIGMTHPQPYSDGDEMRTDSTITEGIPPTIEEIILRQGGDQFTEGLVEDPTPGRTDRLPTSMPADSYVIPADVVSGMGQGNTLAGAKILDAIFKSHGGPAARRAEGGATPATARVPVIVAGGEYIVSPDRVRSVGSGDAAKGHKLLDSFTRRHRVNLVRRLKTLPGPRKD